MRVTLRKLRYEITDMLVKDNLFAAGSLLGLIGSIFLLWLACGHVSQAWGSSVTQFVLGLIGMCTAFAAAIICTAIAKWECWDGILKLIPYNLKHYYNVEGHPKRR